MSNTIEITEEQLRKVRADIKRTILKFYKDLGYVAPELWTEKFHLLALSIDGQICSLKDTSE